jgi:hypothetical protein
MEKKTGSVGKKMSFLKALRASQMSNIKPVKY